MQDMYICHQYLSLDSASINQSALVPSLDDRLENGSLLLLADYQKVLIITL